MIKSSTTLLILLALALVATPTPSRAQTLETAQAVHTSPDSQSAVISILPRGTAITVDTTLSVPDGWIALSLPGPFTAYVLNTDIEKDLTVKAGASLRLKPDEDASELTTLQLGDQAVITGLHGKWTQVRLEKAIVGYIRQSQAPSGAEARIAEPAKATPHAEESSLPTHVEAIPPPARSPQTNIPSSNAIASTLQAHPRGEALPRVFQGVIASTHRPFLPRRPYDWQINDSAGVRFAYLDISHLTFADQIRQYVDREVIIYGTPREADDGKNIVIQVESLRAK